MKNTVLFLRRLANQVKGLFPHALPQGRSEFQALIDFLINTYKLPTVLRDDIVFVLSSEITRFKETVCTVSPYHFVKVIRAAAAKQVAGAHFYEVKARQQEEARKASLTPEATATQASPESVANEPQVT